MQLGAYDIEGVLTRNIDECHNSQLLLHMQWAWLRARGAPGCVGLARWAQSTVHGDWTKEALCVGFLDDRSALADRIAGFTTYGASREAKEAQIVLGPLAEQVSGMMCAGNLFQYGRGMKSIVL